jgi:glycosyltransferase involved in cell wall biosynthesis
VIAQCPVSARAALDVRRRLKMDFKVAMVCHFNYSEATEYRDKGELNSRKQFERMMKLEATVLQTVDQIIYVSNWAQQVVETERGIKPKASQVIWNGIAADTDTPTLCRAAFGLEQDDLVLINVGSLEPRKNQVHLLDLFALLRPRYPSAKLVLVGDGAQRGEIEEKIRRNNLSESVLVLGHRTDVPALLKLSDVYVHYSKLENCPVILLEAARTGLPIAALPAGGVPEIGEKLGGIVPLNDVDLNVSLDAMEPLLKDAALRQEMGRRARSGFESHFTCDAMVQAYIDAIGLAEVRA